MGPQGQIAWVQISPESITGSVTLGRLLNLPEPQFLHLRNRITTRVWMTWIVKKTRYRERAWTST